MNTTTNTKKYSYNDTELYNIFEAINKILSIHNTINFNVKTRDCIYFNDDWGEECIVEYYKNTIYIGYDKSDEYEVTICLDRMSPETYINLDILADYEFSIFNLKLYDYFSINDNNHSSGIKFDSTASTEEIEMQLYMSSPSSATNIIDKYIRVKDIIPDSIRAILINSTVSYETIMNLLSSTIKKY